MITRARLYHLNKWKGKLKIIFAHEPAVRPQLLMGYTINPSVGQCAVAGTETTVRYLLCYAIIVTMLAACSSPAPLRPTTAIEMDRTSPASSPTLPLTTSNAYLEATPAQSPLQPTVTAAVFLTPTLPMEVVDQLSAVDTSRAGWWSISTLGPVGHSFRPSLAGLDAIELWTEDQ
jgi:hypothetical protein